MISSSFADEAIGKLYAELGPLTFGRRIHSISVDPLVRSLIERAIVQRLRSKPVRSCHPNLATSSSIRGPQYQDR